MGLAASQYPKGGLGEPLRGVSNDVKYYYYFYYFYYMG
jgi:hypothetical protein